MYVKQIGSYLPSSDLLAHPHHSLNKNEIEIFFFSKKTARQLIVKIFKENNNYRLN